MSETIEGNVADERIGQVACYCSNNTYDTTFTILVEDRCFFEWTLAIAFFLNYEITYF